MTILIRGYANLWVGAPCGLSSLYKSFDDYDGDIMFLICHVTSNTYLKGYVNLWVDAFTINHHLAIYGEVQVEM